jgi:hypothetical protein
MISPYGRGNIILVVYEPSGSLFEKLGDSLASTDRIEGVGLFEGFT